MSLTLESGGTACLMAPSGRGKTTLLRCIAGLERPDSGRITDLPERIGYVFQEDRLCDGFSAVDNIRLVTGRAMDEGEICRHLKELGLADSLGQPVRELSGGMRQRAAFARTMLTGSDLLLLDEPFSALDSYLKWNLELELADLLALFGGPVLWVSHDLDECYRNCGSVCVMEDGKTGAVTGMDEMIRHAESVSAARLAGCKNFLAAVEKNGAVYLPEWGMALPVAAKGKTFTTLGIPDHAVALSDGGALRCTLCRVISGVEQDILLLRPEHCGEGAPALRVSAARGNSLRAGETVCVALDAEKLLLL